MQDAVVLANMINGLPFHPIATEIEAAFSAYREERYHWASDAYEGSKILRAMAGQVNDPIKRYPFLMGGGGLPWLCCLPVSILLC